MNLKLSRFQFTDNSTIGRLFINGQSTCFTLEDKEREVEGQPVELWKVQGETAIPKGTYTVIVDYSNRFKKDLPRLLNVPGFEGVRIHAGNSAKDTEGCILVGKTFTEDWVNRSREAFIPIMEMMESAYLRGEEITIEIS